ncbi:uncharacterized protein LOC123383019 [Prionailurus iriomotensis]
MQSEEVVPRNSAKRLQLDHFLLLGVSKRKTCISPDHLLQQELQNYSKEKGIE